MTIHDLSAIRQKAIRDLKSEDSESPKDRPVVRGIPGMRGSDKVEISEEARRLASEARESVQEQEVEAEERRELSKERVMEIRRWIDDGFYDLPTTVAEVARRIMDSGDLDIEPIPGQSGSGTPFDA